MLGSYGVDLEFSYLGHGVMERLFAGHYLAVELIYRKNRTILFAFRTLFNGFTCVTLRFEIKKNILFVIIKTAEQVAAEHSPGLCVKGDETALAVGIWSGDESKRPVIKGKGVTVVLDVFHQAEPVLMKIKGNKGFVIAS